MRASLAALSMLGILSVGWKNDRATKRLTDCLARGSSFLPGTVGWHDPIECRHRVDLGTRWRWHSEFVPHAIRIALPGCDFCRAVHMAASPASGCLSPRLIISTYGWSCFCGSGYR